MLITTKQLKKLIRESLNDFFKAQDSGDWGKYDKAVGRPQSGTAPNSSPRPENYVLLTSSNYQDVVTTKLPGISLTPHMWKSYEKLNYKVVFIPQGLDSTHGGPAILLVNQRGEIEAFDKNDYPVELNPEEKRHVLDFLKLK